MTVMIYEPVVRFNQVFGWPPLPPIHYKPPRDTLDPRYDACRYHRVACDCREALFAEDRKELKIYSDLDAMHEEVINAVLHLHSRRGTRCQECCAFYPCPTRRILVGTTAGSRMDQEIEEDGL